MRFGHLSLLVLSVALYQFANAADGRYKEVKWPMSAKTMIGTPSPWHFGQVVAVATTRDGNILLLHRGAHPVMEFDPEGKFLRSWGDGMISEGKVTKVESKDRAQGASGYTAVYGPAGCYSCGAHSVRVDPEGNIWVVDAGAHVVYKTNPPGRVILQLGTKDVSGTDSTHFNLPTDVGFAPNGDLYVSDGYGSARVVKYTADGKYLLQWGKRGTGPGEFGLPHNLVDGAQRRVYVTDRDNRRIQVFDSEGKFLDQWQDVGGVSTLFMTNDQHIWTGGVLRNLKGEIVARLPGDPLSPFPLFKGDINDVFTFSQGGRLDCVSDAEAGFSLPGGYRLTVGEGHLVQSEYQRTLLDRAVQLQGQLDIRGGPR